MARYWINERDLNNAMFSIALTFQYKDWKEAEQQLKKLQQDADYVLSYPLSRIVQNIAEAVSTLNLATDKFVSTDHESSDEE